MWDRLETPARVAGHVGEQTKPSSQQLSSARRHALPIKSVDPATPERPVCRAAAALDNAIARSGHALLGARGLGQSGASMSSSCRGRNDSSFPSPPAVERRRNVRLAGESKPIYNLSSLHRSMKPEHPNRDALLRRGLNDRPDFRPTQIRLGPCNLSKTKTLSRHQSHKDDEQ